MLKLNFSNTVPLTLIFMGCLKLLVLIGGRGGLNYPPPIFICENNRNTGHNIMTFSIVFKNKNGVIDSTTPLPPSKVSKFHQFI